VDRTKFFEALWTDFAAIAPQAAAIRRRLEEHGEQVENDHVAFRTFNLGPVSLERLEPLVLGLGYSLLDEYRFEDKHLRARAYVCPDAPRLFLSELLCEELSGWAQAIINQLLAQAPGDFAASPRVFWSGRPWAPLRFAEYERLSNESEYAGWLAALGFRPNHFTVSINRLARFTEVAEVLDFVEAAGYRINASGGRVKGSRDVLLEQGSTLADRVPVQFADGPRIIPTCYYEFALRHPDASGRLYEGFVPASADRIFESTHRAKP
jgi:2-oxoadipate dioxygenase/decarboxylase-like protein